MNRLLFISCYKLLNMVIFLGFKKSVYVNKHGIFTKYLLLHMVELFYKIFYAFFSFIHTLELCIQIDQ